MRKRLLTLFLLAFFGAEAMLFAQDNLIVNGDFEQGNTDFETNYVFVETGVVEAGHFCIDYSSEGHGGGVVGWPTVLGCGGSGKYMMVNGFGGEYVNPYKVIWSQTVLNLEPQTDYVVSFQVVNLGRSILGYNPNPAKLHLNINGNDMDVEYELPADNEWHLMEYVWNSGTARLADIAFFDFFTGDSGLGDDFGLDQIYFGPANYYSVTANDDQAGSVCLGNTLTVNVLENDVMQPNDNEVTVMLLSNPEHGTAVVLADNTISYSYIDAIYTGTTDQFQYRVYYHDATSDATVFVTLSRPPIVGEITAPEGICAGESFDLTLPSIDGNGSAITQQGWEIAPTPSDQFNPLNNSNIPYDYNGYYLRYSVINDCGKNSSNLVQVEVYSDEPVFDTVESHEICHWHGIDFYCSCDTTIQVTTPGGCEIEAHLHFEKRTTTIPEVVSICDSVTINGVHYDQPGTYSVYYDTVYSQGGCDSVYFQKILTILNSSNVGVIEGDSCVYVASSLLSGIYLYEIDTSGMASDVDWTLSNPDWIILDHDAVSCRILVTTPGVATLSAHFIVEDCGEMERTLTIRAGFFDTEEHGLVKAKVFPNPTNGSLMVEAEDIKSVRVVDMMGQTMLQKHYVGTNLITLQIGNLPPSVYLVETKTDSGLSSCRVVLCK